MVVVLQRKVFNESLEEGKFFMLLNSKKLFEKVKDLNDKFDKFF